jgi:hypothetical protein
MNVPDSGTFECVVDPEKPKWVEIFLNRRANEAAHTVRGEPAS